MYKRATVCSLLFTAMIHPALADRLDWFREGKFGMFIHWGIYSLLGRGEWVMHNERIPIPEYEKLYPQFDPTEYRPREWAWLAKAAGMRYVVVTSKHHDGFCMFDSTLTDYDCMSTPAQRDFIGELVEAYRGAGLKVMFYYSLLDWHHPHYMPKPTWVEDPPGHQRDFNQYLDYLFGQVRELCEKYRPDGIWFDGGWEHPPQEWRAQELVEMIHQILPNAVVNNRTGLPADYDTPEQFIPATGQRGPQRRLWETCMTINDHWGYAREDRNHKSVRQLVHHLVDIVSKGGNYLLNVGPTPLGTIQEEHAVRLRQVGAWLWANSEAIYDTEPSPFRQLPASIGGCTVKDKRLFLHLFEWPSEPVVIEGLQNRFARAYLLRDGTPVRVGQRENRLTIHPAAIVPDPYDTIVVLELSGPPRIDASIFPQPDGSLDLHARFAEIHGTKAHYESGGGKDNIGYWVDETEWVSWEMVTRESGRYQATLIYACEPGSEGSEVEVTVDGQWLTTRIEATASWTDFCTVMLGEFTLAPGRHLLSVKPLSKPRGAVMNLQRVLLKPVSR